MNKTINGIEINLIPGPRYVASTQPHDKNRVVYSATISSADTGQTIKTYGKLTYTQAMAFCREFNRCQ